jgi:16S rRNA C1402 (ribose-2'-O) methylase RsmI
VYGQKSLDTRIIVTVSDTTGLYEKVRMAFVDEGIMIVDNRRTDSISTHPYNLQSTTYLLTYAAIKDNTVVFWGYLADANTNLLGITVNPSKNQYQKIFYYPRDKYWKKLKKIAERVGVTLSYGKEK